MTMKLHGGPEMSRELSKLSVKVATNLGRASTRAGAQVLAQAARDNVATSQYARSLPRLIKKRGGDIRVVQRRSKNGHVRSSVTTRKRAWFAHFFEFGTDPHDIPKPSKKRARRKKQLSGWTGGRLVFFGKSVRVSGIKPIRFMTRAFHSSSVSQRALDEMGAHMRKGLIREGAIKG
jgi:HK97 gp10 family phage protein